MRRMDSMSLADEGAFGDLGLFGLLVAAAEEAAQDHWGYLGFIVVLQSGR